MNQRIDMLAKSGATMRSLEESAEWIAVLVSQVEKMTNRITELEAELEKYQPVKQKVAALFKPTKPEL